MTFFKRKGWAKPITNAPQEYLPGDIVAWKLSDGRPHIGVVGEVPVPETQRRLCIHNIGDGAQLEDVLFEFTIIGHYRPFTP